ncbi:MAG: GntR family transcriptional regulator [Treponema sp.]|jgi:GntR family transcriptional regulator|nr:GntR family transcriptional regulator [Treponema sp.]
MKERPVSVNPQLLYKQVEEKIRSEIKNGKWKAGDRLPGEYELSSAYKVSRVTLRTAISHLVEEGLLLRLHGKGTFVTSGPFIHDNYHHMQSFTNLCRIQGHTASAKLLYAGLRDADETARRFLSIPEGEQVFALDRLRLVDDTPLVLEFNVFRRSYLFLQDRDLSGSLYELFAEYAIFPNNAIKTVGICMADELCMKHLGVARETALLLSSALVYDDKNEPLHTVKQIYRVDLPELFKYYIYQKA